MKNTVRVIVYKEYEVDVSEFLPGCVRIKDFVKEFNNFVNYRFNSNHYTFA